MHCEPIEELIGAYVDDSLPAEARRRVEAHLLGCQPCAWQAQTQRIARDRLRAHAGGDVIASDAFRARVLARLRADNPQLFSIDETAADDSRRIIDEPSQYRLPMGV